MDMEVKNWQLSVQQMIALKKFADACYELSEAWNDSGDELDWNGDQNFGGVLNDRGILPRISLDEVFGEVHELMDIQNAQNQKLLTATTEVSIDFMSFAEEYQYVCGPLSCGSCDSERVKLTGKVETDGAGGLFVVITCLSCGKTDQDGDGAFFNYFGIRDEGIYRLEDEEETPDETSPFDQILNDIVLPERNVTPTGYIDIKVITDYMQINDPNGDWLTATEQDAETILKTLHEWIDDAPEAATPRVQGYMVYLELLKGEVDA